MLNISVIVTFLIILAIHRYILSCREKVWLGAIVPIIYTIFVIFILVHTNHNLSLSDYVPFTLGLTILLSFWVDGHYSYKKKLEQELETTKAKDNQY
ncbi:hypothetical protein [Staphylococcus epidermidis]|uniref:Uncharacterized protein n=1 Tax=Staphylococcus epidermidis TaxID=1282 RepID=H9BG67_STAEP|nr:hypothetical protein [Staphylococcus epidermidis]AFD03078.1 epidermicin locus hypothetical protein [Staphylococcus epidermidis]UVZ00163.1 hypothetical protein [Staphylococcus epidermidis]